MSVEIGSLLSRDDNSRAGRYCVTGTLTEVNRIVTWYKQGESPEEIAREYPHLSLAGVYAALAYYHANQAEVEAELADDLAQETAIEAEWQQLRHSKVA